MTEQERIDIKELSKKIDELRDEQTEIRTALKGYNGSKQGLIPAFEEHCRKDSEFRADYYKFKRACLAVFFTIIGATGLSGLGVGIAKLASALTGS